MNIRSSAEPANSAKDGDMHKFAAASGAAIIVALGVLMADPQRAAAQQAGPSANGPVSISNAPAPRTMPEPLPDMSDLRPIERSAPQSPSSNTLPVPKMVVGPATIN